MGAVEISPGATQSIQNKSKGTFRTAVAFLIAFYFQNFYGQVSGPLAAGICLLSLPLLMKHTDIKVLGTIVACVAMAATLSLFSMSSEGAFLGLAVIASLQLGYMLVIGYALFLVLTRITATRFTSLCFLGMYTLLGLTVIELYTPFREVMNSFRYEFYGSRVYTAVERDIAIAGGLRPTALASEPSYLALYLSLFFVGALFTSRDLLTRFGAFICLALAIVLVRSPAAISAVVAIGIFYTTALFKQSWAQSWKVTGREKLALLVLFYAGLIVVLAIGRTLEGAPLIERFGAIFSGEDRSFIARISGPWEVARLVVEASPFFGAGIGGNEVAEPLIYLAFSGLLTTYHYHYDAIAGYVGPMAISHIIYFGIVGGTAMAASYHLLFRRMLGGNGLLFWFLAIAFTFPIGGYSYHAWVAVFFVSASIYHASKLRHDLGQTATTPPKPHQPTPSRSNAG